MRTAWIMISCGLLSLGNISAQTTRTQDKKPQSGVAYIGMLKATKQKQVSATTPADVHTNYKMLLVWRSNQAPTTFFWHAGNQAWMTCAVTRAHAYKRNSASGADGTLTIDPDFKYTSEVIELGQIKKGDTLIIEPMRGGRDIKPAVIPANLVNYLYFQTASGNRWLYFPVKTLIQLKDMRVD